MDAVYLPKSRESTLQVLSRPFSVRARGAVPQPMHILLATIIIS